MPTTNPEQAAILTTRVRWAYRVVIFFPYLIIAQFVGWLLFPGALSSLAWTQYTLLPQLVLITPGVWFLAKFYDRRTRRRLQPYLDAHNAQVCLDCLYPTVDIPASTPPRTRCPECGSAWDPDELTSLWQARRTAAPADLFIPRWPPRRGRR